MIQSISILIVVLAVIPFSLSAWSLQNSSFQSAQSYGFQKLDEFAFWQIQKTNLTCQPQDFGLDINQAMQFIPQVALQGCRLNISQPIQFQKQGNYLILKCPKGGEPQYVVGIDQSEERLGVVKKKYQNTKIQFSDKIDFTDKE